MRLLHLIHSADPASGGPIEGVKQLAAAGSSRNIEIDLLTLDPPDASYLKGFPLKVRAFGDTHLGKYGYSPELVPWLRQNRQKI